MANGNVVLPRNTWVELADSNITICSWQVKGSGDVYVAATSGPAAPTGSHEDWPRYQHQQGEVGIDATALFAGVAGAARLWAYSPGQNNLVWRSHG